MFNFSIVSIHAGWFDVRISNETKEVNISNSWYLNNDAPRILLKNLNYLANEVFSTCWLCWHDEPGACLWCLNKEKDTLHYRIADAIKDSDELCYEGIELCDEKIFEERISGYTPFNEFYSAIVKAIKDYSYDKNLETYTREWGEFPFEELNKAVEILRLT